MRQPREVAIPELLARHGGRLYAIGRRLCGDPDEAQDLVQETFLQAWRKWDQFEGRSSPTTWLFTIAARLCQRMHRKRAGEPQHMASLQELLPFAGGAMPLVPGHDGQAPLGEQLRAEAVDRLEQAIVSLPLAFRLPLVLKEIVGLPVADVAAILGVKEATVKTRLHRARLKLRQRLEQVLPATDGPPPAYAKQVCLDLLRAKQEALDRGVPMAQDVVCDRCRAVFASLDLGHDLCHQLGEGELPDPVRLQVLAALAG